MKSKCLAVLVLLCLGACSTTSAAKARSAKPGSKPGGVLTIRIGNPASIDPANSFERWGQFVDSLLCDSLISLDPLSGEPRPAIAKSWIVENGGTLLTFHLRKDVRFQNGDPVSAEDVAFALTRVASEEEASNTADALRPVDGFAFVHGDAQAPDESQTTSLMGVRAIGNDAIQISLSEPRADFFRVLAMPLAAPEPRTLVVRDPGAFEQQPICTGPYMLDHPWHSGDTTISLHRFAGYYGANTAFTRGGRGYADRIQLVIGGEGTTPPLQADAAAVTRAVPTGSWSALNAPTPYIEYIGLPVGTPPFDRREVRIALSQAIDRSAIARDVYGGVRTPATSFIPPAFGSIAQNDACGFATPQTRDLVAARQSLATAGVSLRGASITIGYNPDFDNEALVSAVAQSWSDAFGAHVTLKASPWDQYLESARSATGFTAPFRMGWQPPTPTPDDMLSPLFSSSSIGVNNFTRWSDPRFDRTLERDARRAGSDQDLRDAYRHLQDILCEQLPAIPVVFGGARYLVDTTRVDSAVGSFVDLSNGSLLVREMFVR
ncbi:MAG: ABC transporter substrate-binding protein [Actinomycetota bacterium]